VSSTNNIGYLLQHISAILAHQTDQVLQERLGIGFSQYKILSVLNETPNIQQRQIAVTLGQTEASISRQIKLLAEQGLLTSIAHPQNRREHVATLTPRGSRYIDEALRIINTYHAPAFRRLGEKQQLQLLEHLSTLHDSICNAPHPAA
jgi:DNA-binding MarR family transcriptional regulator